MPGSGGMFAVDGGGGAGSAPTLPRQCNSGQTKGSLCDIEGAACTAPCGPKGVGYKFETCTTGIYLESNCMFDPAQDYSCFVLPVLLAVCDPSGPVANTTLCSVPDCTPCGPDYVDASGNARIGYCVCWGGLAGNWSCASPTAWPPQP
jgi:hypothetical protein